MSPDSVLHMLHRVLKRAGLPKVRFHDLRHTFATLALQNGVDIKTVSGMLGHFSAGFTLGGGRYMSVGVLISCEIRTFFVLFCLITYLLFFLTQTLTPTGADSGKHYTAPERMLPIVFAASRLAEVVT